MRHFFLYWLAFLPVVCFSQEPTGLQLLEKAIAYHDPNGNWQNFRGKLQVKMTTANEDERLSDITLDLPKEYFQLITTKDGVVLEQTLSKGACELKLNGNKEISEDDKKTHRLSCERANMYKDYYTYLYGLPMKLRNPGTIIDPKVRSKTFKGKEYLVLKVNYTEAVGKDTWYFYFDPTSYAMEVYQFYHDEANNDGEYIVLSGEEEVSGIKMPKNRAWYYNKDDKHLGTDLLTKASVLVK